MGMKKVDEATLKQAVDRLMFKLTDEEYTQLLDEFDTIIAQMNIIGEIEGVDDAFPMTFPFDISNDYLREDVPSKPLSREELLKNTTDVVDGKIRIPRVVKYYGLHEFKPPRNS